MISSNHLSVTGDEKITALTNAGDGGTTQLLTLHLSLFVDFSLSIALTTFVLSVCVMQHKDGLLACGGDFIHPMCILFPSNQEQWRK